MDMPVKKRLCTKLIKIAFKFCYCSNKDREAKAQIQEKNSKFKKKPLKTQGNNSKLKEKTQFLGIFRILRCEKDGQKKPARLIFTKLDSKHFIRTCDPCGIRSFSPSSLMSSSEPPESFSCTGYHVLSGVITCLLFLSFLLKATSFHGLVWLFPCNDIDPNLSSPCAAIQGKTLLVIN